MSTVPQRTSRRALVAVLLAGVGLAGLTGCFGRPTEGVTNRLWVSEMPKGPRHAVTSFVVSDVRGKRVGAFLRGSAYRGAHDAFVWVGDDAKAEIRMLQDGVAHRVRIERCKPSRGFDRCIVVHGDPAGVGRYESRKRWSFRERGELDAREVLVELGERDPDLHVFTTAPDLSAD